jgi:3'-phosphoadenosine 5'-phosphosulfate sulfotransferase (PAPS reductase)/FAD synthetase
MKKYISFSGGVESTTMCILYGKGATAIFCDAGAEHQKMYERLDMCEQKLKEIHNGDFELIRIKPLVNQKGMVVSSLTEYIINASCMPSGLMRFCTRMFKIEPIDLFLKNAGECELMIGFNADEEGRTGNLQMMPNVHYTMPLIEDGLNRNDCEIILRQHDLHPNLPPYMSRGGCKFCFYKSKKDYKALYFFNQLEYIDVMEFEEKIQDKRKKFYSIMQNGLSLRMLMQECEQEASMFGIEQMKEMYKDTSTSQACGAFCHR